MRKATMAVHMLVFTMLSTLTLIIPPATANYLVYNGSRAKDAYVIYAYWNEDRRPSAPSNVSTVKVMPNPGFLVSGYYKVKPGTFTDLSLPNYVRTLYVRIAVDGKPLVPDREKSSLGYSFKAHPSKAFSHWESGDGKRIWRISEGVNRRDLVLTSGFYKYSNDGTFTISGPLKYGFKTLDFQVEGNKIPGGGWRYWDKTFYLPGKVLFIRRVKNNSYGRGGAELDHVTPNGNKVTANGRIEDGYRIRGKLHIILRIYYRK